VKTVGSGQSAGVGARDAVPCIFIPVGGDGRFNEIPPAPLFKGFKAKVPGFLSNPFAQPMYFIPFVEFSCS